MDVVRGFLLSAARRLRRACILRRLLVAVLRRAAQRDHGRQLHVHRRRGLAVRALPLQVRIVLSETRQLAPKNQELFYLTVHSALARLGMCALPLQVRWRVIVGTVGM